MRRYAGAGRQVCRYAGPAGTAIGKVRLKCTYLDEGFSGIAQRNLVNGCSGK